MSPRSAHLRIFLAIRRRTRCSSAPIERPLHARSRATSILASVRESKLSAIMTVFFIELQQSLQAYGLAGLPRFAKNMPCKSAALRRMPACFIASFRSGPGGIVRACSRAASASASSSSLGRRFSFGRGIEPKYVGRFRLVSRVLDSGTRAATRRPSQLEHCRPALSR